LQVTAITPSHADGMAEGSKDTASIGSDSEDSKSGAESDKSMDNLIRPSPTIVRLFVRLYRHERVIRKGLVDGVELQAMVIRSMMYVEIKQVVYKWAASDWFVEGKTSLLRQNEYSQAFRTTQDVLGSSRRHRSSLAENEEIYDTALRTAR
jgi:hypothetical protein